jgi:hypothetical protein
MIDLEESARRAKAFSRQPLGVIAAIAVAAFVLKVGLSIIDGLFDTYIVETITKAVVETAKLPMGFGWLIGWGAFGLCCVLLLWDTSPNAKVLNDWLSKHWRSTEAKTLTEERDRLRKELAETNDELKEAKQTISAAEAHINAVFYRHSFGVERWEFEKPLSDAIRTEIEKLRPLLWQVHSASVELWNALMPAYGHTVLGSMFLEMSARESIYRLRHSMEFLDTFGERDRRLALVTFDVAYNSYRKWVSALLLDERGAEVLRSDKYRQWREVDDVYAAKLRELYAADLFTATKRAINAHRGDEYPVTMPSIPARAQLPSTVAPVIIERPPESVKN